MLELLAPHGISAVKDAVKPAGATPAEAGLERLVWLLRV
jgi:hypothetical protein